MLNEPVTPTQGVYLSVDVPELASRYELQLTLYPRTGHYLLTVINHGAVSVYTHSKFGTPDFKYPLLNKGVSKADAEAISFIISNYLSQMK